MDSPHRVRDAFDGAVRHSGVRSEWFRRSSAGEKWQRISKDRATASVTAIIAYLSPGLDVFDLDRFGRMSEICFGRPYLHRCWGGRISHRLQQSSGSRGRALLETRDGLTESVATGRAVGSTPIGPSNAPGGLFPDAPSSRTFRRRDKLPVLIGKAGCVS